MGLRRFAQRRKKDADLAEEIESHLAHEEAANIARGMSPQEARRQARLKFGNPDSVRERVWRYRSLPWIEDALARSSLCAALTGQNARVHRRRRHRDCGRNWGEYSRLFGHQHRAAQAPYLSRAAGIGAVDEYRAAGNIPRRQRA